MLSRAESLLREFARTPLDQVITQVTSRLEKMPLMELEALVLGEAEAGAPPSLDAFAQSILSLPTRGSKLAEAERSVVTHALQMTEGNVSAAARLLGVDRKALERKIARYKRR